MAFERTLKITGSAYDIEGEEKKSKLATRVASMGMPPLRVDDGLVELSIQVYGAKRRLAIENYPAGSIPKVGALINSTKNAGEPLDFVVVQVKHLLVPRAAETVRVVLLLIRRPPRV